MQPGTLDGGFADPARDSAFAFRAVMTAMARPGTIHRIAGAAPPAPLSPAAGAALLTLADPDTPLWLAGGCDTQAVRAWLGFHTGAPPATPETCAFALGRWEDLMPLHRYRQGTPDYPDRSASLIVELDRLEPEGATLAGPGIETAAALSLPETAAFRQNAAGFPLGLDFLFTCADRIAALPRSTRVG